MSDALQVIASLVFSENDAAKAEGVLWVRVTDRSGNGVRGLTKASFSLLPLQDASPTIKEVFDYSGKPPEPRGPYTAAKDAIDFPEGLYRVTLAGGPMAYAIVGQFAQIIQVTKYPADAVVRAAGSPETGLGMFAIVKTK